MALGRGVDYRDLMADEIDLSTGLYVRIRRYSIK